MENLRNKKAYKRALAGLLAFLLFLGSIPFNGYLTHQVQAEDPTLSPFIVVVNGIVDATADPVEKIPLNQADVQITTVKPQTEGSVAGHPAITAQAAATSVSGQYALTQTDYDAFVQWYTDEGITEEENKKINITVTRKGYDGADNQTQSVIENAAFSEGVAGNLMTDMVPNMFGTQVFVNQNEDSSTLVYQKNDDGTPKAQELIKVIKPEDNFNDDVKISDDTAPRAVYRDTDYTVQYSTTGTDYSNDIPKESNVGTYTVYVKTIQTCFTYSRKDVYDASGKSQGNIADEDTIQYEPEIVSIRKYTSEIKKATVDDFKLYNTDGSEQAERTFRTAWNTQVWYDAQSVTFAGSDVEYSVEDTTSGIEESKKNADKVQVNATDKKITFAKECVNHTYTVTAKMTDMAERAQYVLPSLSYTIQVTAVEGTHFGFQDTELVERQYGMDTTYTNVYEILGVTDVDVTYEIIEKKIDNKVISADSADYNNKVATINAATGELTILGAGKVTVAARLSDEDMAAYGITADACAYTLGINKADAEITFGADADYTLKYLETPQSKTATVTKGVGDVKYTIASSALSSGTASVDENTGVVTVNGVGTIVVKATLPESDNYNAAEATYTITVSKAQVALSYAQAEYDVDYGMTQEIFQPLSYKVNGRTLTDSEADNKIKNQIYQGIRFESANVTEGFVLNQEKVTLPEKEGQITVNASFAENGFFESAEASYVLKQKIKAADAEGDGTSDTTYLKKFIGSVKNWYTQDITIQAMPGYKVALKSDRASFGADVQTENSIKVEKSVENKQLYYYEESTGTILKGRQINLKIDKTAPEVTYEIDKTTRFIKDVVLGHVRDSYTENDKADVKFGHGTQTDRLIVLTVSTADSTSGIQSVKVMLKDQELTPQTGSEEVTAEGKKIAKYVLDKADYDNVKIIAKDNAGLETNVETTEKFVVDSTAPVITAALEDNADFATLVSTNKPKVLKLTVNEANFVNKSDLTFAITKDNNETDKTIVNGDTLAWTKSGNSYEANYNVSEDGTYTIHFEKYQDPSGNDSNELADMSFVIDTLKPVVTLDAAKTPSKSEVPVTVKVQEELGFDTSKVDIVVTQVNGGTEPKAVVYEEKKEKEIALSQLKDELHDAKYWDGKNIQFKLVTEGTYDIQVTAKDASENASDEVKTQGIIYDKTAPTDLKYTLSPDVELDAKDSAYFYPANVSEVRIELDAQDSVSKVKEYTYTITDKEGKKTTSVADSQENGKATIYLQGDQNSQITYQAVDNAGNRSKEQTIPNIIIDTTSPELTASYTYKKQVDGKDQDVAVDTYSANDVTMKLSLTDDNYYESEVGLTISKAEYTPFNGEQQDITDTLKQKLKFAKAENTANLYETVYTFTQDGTYTLNFRYTDKSGNQSELIGKKFVINHQKPQITVGTNADSSNGYTKEEVTAEITITDDTFDANRVDTVLQAQDYDGKNVASFEIKISGVAGQSEDIVVESIADFKNTLKEAKYWAKDGAKNVCKITYQTEANYSLNVNYINSAGSKADETKKKFTYDKSAPQDITVSYSKDSQNSKHDYLFFNEEVTVTVTDKDMVAGIANVQYSLDGGQNFNTLKVEKNKDNQHIGTFTVSAPYRGEIQYKVTDKAGNEIIKKEAIIVDKTAPVIGITYLDKNQKVNNTYYTGAKKPEILITESNLFTDREDAGLVSVKIEYTAKPGAEKETKEYNASHFKAAADHKDQWELQLDEADAELKADGEYKITVTAKDYSKNIADVAVDSFIIDNTNPEIQVDFGKDEATLTDNAYYFQNERKATVTFTERNFNKDKIDVKVTEDGKDVSDSYASVLKNSIKDSGDIHTGTITFSNNATYTFSVAYTDEAGRKNQSVTYVHTDKDGQADDANVAKDSSTKFTVDTVNPILNVEYSGTVQKENTEINKKYYDNDVKASIDVVEKNFRAAGLKMIVEYTPFNGTKVVTETNILEKSYQNGKAEYEYQTSYTFSQDGDYKVTIQYVDPSGRTSGDARIENFAIDKINPSISVAVVDEDGKNIGAGADAYKYSAQELTSTITIKEAGPFRPDAVKIGLTATNDNNVQNNHNRITPQLQVFDESTEKYVTISDIQDIKNYWKNENDIHTVTVKYPNEANYELTVDYTDYTNRAAETIVRKFTYDKSEPTDVSITYDVAPKTEQYGYKFFNQNVIKVTLAARDVTSGVSAFRYSTDAGKTYKMIDVKDMKISYNKQNQSIYQYTFEIPAQYKNKIVFEATDKAGNKKTVEDDIVVDTEASGIKVKYHQDVKGNSYIENRETKESHMYYQQIRNADIIITENNFYPENASVKITETLNDGKVNTYSYGGTKDSSDFKQIEGTNRWKLENVAFDKDADYTIAIVAKDYSGHNTTYNETFTIDTINPKLNVSFNDKAAIETNADQFKNDRTATITFTEHNFNREDIVVTVVENNDSINQEATSAGYKKQLLDSMHKGKNQDEYVGTITFSNDANYTFDISYTDKSGRKSDISYQNDKMSQELAVQTAKKFTVDKTAPEIEISMNGISGNNENEEQEKKEQNWSRVWENKTHNDGNYVVPDNGLTFGLWSKQTVKVSSTNTDNLSGIESIRYYKASSAFDSLDALKKLEEEKWVAPNVENGLFTFDINPNEKVIVYVRTIDRAGNVSYASSNGVVVDNIAPTGDVQAPQVFISTNQVPVNGLYGDTVTLDISAYDPASKDQDNRDFYSGLQKVSYSITTEDTDASETGEFVFTSDDFNNVTEKMQNTFAVDGTTFNSNKVHVNVSVVDNAGNINYGSMELSIDTTAPTIQVTYDNDNGDTAVGDRAYFNQARTATVDVTERNFDENAVNMLIQATDGVMPNISGWEEIAADGNGDNTIHRATVNYYADGDYTFDINFADMVGNQATEVQYTGLAPTEFTVDLTNPVISVSYDNTDVVNGNYYNQARTATVSIEEHNFETSRVIPTITAEGGEAITPQISDWSMGGDTHTATITYPGDSMYSFAIQYTDMAGNEAVPYDTESFYVDVTAPELSIENVENQRAYKDDVIQPSIVYSDQYYDSVDISLTGAQQGTVSVDNIGSYANDENGGRFTFNNLETDDIYTLSARVVDKAGNATEQSVEFSVNRNGSTYGLDDATAQLNGTYVATAQDVVIREVNPDELLEHKITLYKNDKTITLIENTDYTVSVNGGNGQWYEYVYTIAARNFADDGVYRISVQSTDKAGNIAENTIASKDKEVSFGVDATLPNIIMMNLESNTTYPLDSMVVRMSVNDNLKLSAIEVYLDGNIVKTWNEQDIKQKQAGNEEYTFEIGNATQARSVQVVATDAAGNQQRLQVDNFYVTTNLWIRFYTNTALLWGTIAGVAIVVAGGAYFIVMRGKKKNNA